MSAIGGIFVFEQTPVDEDDLFELSCGLESRGPDGGGTFTAESIGMVYRAFHTNRDSRSEHQPFVAPTGHVLCWDGRLDNRDELICSLRGHIPADRTDAAIVSAAYEKWGSEFVNKLIGDFALSLWEPKTRTLILARDPIGTRTLYYHKSNQRIIWSTELGLLLDLSGIELEINDDYVAGFLTFLPEPCQTPYKGIEAVPPGEVALVKANQVQLKKFWNLDPNHQIQYQTDGEYEEHFRQLFRDAVRSRLRADVPVWSELSGGLDSSSIVCMAEDIIRNRETEAPSLHTVSMVFDEASKSDERKYIQAVERKLGKSGLHLREDEYRLLAPLKNEYSPNIPNHMANFAEYYNALYQQMKRDGARILLSGKGGDEILGSARDPFPELADLLVKGKLLKLHERIQVWSEALNKSYFRVLWQNALARLLPKNLQYRRRRGFDDVLNLYDPTFVKRLKLRQRLWGPSDMFGFRQPSGRTRVASFLYVPRELSAGYWRELCNLEFSYPFTHRPLIEFMHAIPYEQLVRPYQSKSLLRRALRDLLPTEISNRKGKARTADAFAKAGKREKMRLQMMLTDALACARGYLNLSTMQIAIANEILCSPIILLSPFEHWLQTLESHKSLRSQHTKAYSRKQPMGNHKVSGVAGVN